MSISNVSPLSILTSDLALPKISTPTIANSSSPSFTNALRGAIETLDKQQIGTEHEMARAISGQSPDLHQTIANLQTADLSFQFALQVRNKIIGAYEEIMRMQV